MFEKRSRTLGEDVAAADFVLDVLYRLGSDVRGRGLVFLGVIQIVEPALAPALRSGSRVAASAILTSYYLRLETRVWLRDVT